MTFIVSPLLKMNEQEEYAVLSKAAYDWYHGDHDLAKEELEAYGLPYRFDTEHSDANSVTIVNQTGVQFCRIEERCCQTRVIC